MKNVLWKFNTLKISDYTGKFIKFSIFFTFISFMHIVFSYFTTRSTLDDIRLTQATGDKTYYTECETT